MSVDDEIRRLRKGGAGLLDIAKRLGVPLSRVTEVVKAEPAKEPVLTQPIMDTSLHNEVAELRKELALLREEVKTLKLLMAQGDRPMYPAWSEWMGAREIADALGVLTRDLHQVFARGGQPELGIVAGRKVEARRGLTKAERLRYKGNQQLMYRYEL